MTLHARLSRCRRTVSRTVSVRPGTLRPSAGGLRPARSRLPLIAAGLTDLLSAVGAMPRTCVGYQVGGVLETCSGIFLCRCTAHDVCQPKKYDAIPDRFETFGVESKETIRGGPTKRGVQGDTMGLDDSRRAPLILAWKLGAPGRSIDARLSRWTSPHGFPS